MLNNDGVSTSGTDADEVLGGTTGNDRISGQGGNDLILGDSLNSNPDAPLDFTTNIDGLPFSGGTVNVTVNGQEQATPTSVGTDGSAEIKLAADDLDNGDISIEVSGIIPKFTYEFFDSVPNGFSAKNIPETGADFTGTAEDLNVRNLALDLTGSHDTYSVGREGRA